MIDSAMSSSLVTPEALPSGLKLQGAVHEILLIATHQANRYMDRKAARPLPVRLAYVPLIFRPLVMICSA